LDPAANSPDNGTDGGTSSSVTTTYCGNSGTAPTSSGSGNVRRLSSISIAFLGFCRRPRRFRVQHWRSTKDEGNASQHEITDARHV
jgi:hypothetical protein